MNEYNEQGQPHGQWENYYSDGKLWYKENYLNGQLHGTLERYNSNGKIQEIEYYIK